MKPLRALERWRRAATLHADGPSINVHAGELAPMFLARTADLLADENIRCRGLENVDAARQPWLLVDLDAADFLSDAGWRVVGGYTSEAEATVAASVGDGVHPFPALSAPAMPSGSAPGIAAD